MSNIRKEMVEISSSALGEEFNCAIGEIPNYASDPRVRCCCTLCGVSEADALDVATEDDVNAVDGVRQGPTPLRSEKSRQDAPVSKWNFAENGIGLGSRPWRCFT